MTKNSRWTTIVKSLHDREIILACEVQRFFGQLFVAFEELAKIGDLEQEVTRMAVSQRPVDG